MNSRHEEIGYLRRSEPGAVPNPSLERTSMPASKFPHLRRASVAFACTLFCSMAFAQSNSDQRFPDVVDVKVRVASRGAFNFDVTVASPYDTPSRYADGFRVSTVSGQVLGERKLLHDHQNEQPFTRDLYDVQIPASIGVVVVQARDQKHGYGGKSVQIHLPGR